ncbi:DsbA family protein [Aurantimicrobium minutum]|uniref:DsbA family protein n=1 Tax=Aurantimicrobium minutum TaxID=708131 RepID=UPI0024732519|nr:thioredoxin domain-containing protein [Aurantimicrobium minutum]MDH6239894.1 protein-disulfide isomerase [Aurantimicrobium minutum]
MSTGAHGNRPTRNQQREAARAKAKELREQQVKTEKRRRLFLQGGIGLGIIAIATIFIVTLATSGPKEGPRPANMASDGIVLSGSGMGAILSDAGAPGSDPIATTPTPGSSTVNIVVYQDYLCPACKAFDEANAQQLQTLVEAGAATLELHPIGMLASRSAGTQYSLRATAAAACVAEYSPNTFWAVNQAFYTNQPQEGTPGWNDDEIKALIAQQKPQNQTKIDKCIADQTFIPWAKQATDYALNGPMADAAKQSGANGVGTPTILVNGKVYTGSIVDPKEFLAFITQVAGDSASTTPATPAAG